MEKELYSKDQSFNTSQGAEAIVLPDTIKTLQTKSHTIIEGSITIIVDNKKVWEMSHSTLNISNKYNQDSTAKAMMIQELVNQATISINIK